MYESEVNAKNAARTQISGAAGLCNFNRAPQENPGRVTEIPQALRSLEVHIEETERLACALSAALTPILTTPTPVEAPDKMAAYQSPLAEKIREFNCSLLTVLVMLRGIEGRIEL